ncbi:hypothetical protein [Streptosporangium sp. KLBMP 9127]|nr:hypothetical protein [Streptosporangium sp. KLBMP 9127]
MRRTRHHLRRATLAAGLTALLSTFVSTGAPTPASAGLGCTPAWSIMPAAAVDADIVDVSVIAPNDVRFTENLSFAGIRTLRWDGRSLIENGPQIAVPPRTSTAFEAGNASFDSAGSGWAHVRMNGSARPDGARMLARWAGGRWTLTPGAPGTDPTSGGPRAEDIASLAPDLAWAVGTIHGTGYQAFIERWDGTEWTMVDHPAADRPTTSLSALKAVSATDVWAVGFSRSDGAYHPLVLHNDGTAWTESPLPDIGPSGYLKSISATGPDDVWIGGFTGDEFESAPLLLHWDGKSWSSMPTPEPGPHGTEITRLYAAAPGDLWAVAVDTQQNNGFRLTHWDGTTWQDVKPQGAQPSEYGFNFSDVGGSGPDDVWVVGTSTFTEPSGIDYPFLRSRRLIAHLSCGGK